MSIKPINHHYSMENPSTVYDEEALTTLQLVGRLGAKVNEVVKHVNGLFDNVPVEVARWLEAHPEITTTVQDGEITLGKLHDALKHSVVNGYVTPEMYGAVGDGVADDTDAVQQCFRSDRFVLLKGTYRVTRTLGVDGVKNLTVMGGTLTKDARSTYNLIEGMQCENITFKGVTFDGKGYSTEILYDWRDFIGGCILMSESGIRLTVEDCVIKNFNYGVYLGGADYRHGTTNVYDNTSYNSVIRGCVFMKCNSAIDTYGKNVLIDGNSFINITEHAIQIEPNSVSGMENGGAPDENVGWYTAGAGCVISNNFLWMVDGIAINIHSNAYGVKVTGNTVIHFNIGVNAYRDYIRGCVISDNFFYNQHLQSFNPETRPWMINPVILAGDNVDVHHNYIEECTVGIRVVRRANASHNRIVSACVSGIVMVNLDGIVAHNKIEKFNRHGESWWASRALVINAGTGVCLIGNMVDTPDQPIYCETQYGTPSLFVDGLISTTEQEDPFPDTGGLNRIQNY